MKRLNVSALLVIALCYVLFPGMSWGQEKKITFDQAFKRGQPRIFNSMPYVTGWQDADHYLTMDMKRGAIIATDAVSGEEKVFLDYSLLASLLPSDISSRSYECKTDDYKAFIYKKDNDLYYLRPADSLFKRLTANPAEEKNPLFSPDGNLVAFTREHDLYVVDVNTGLEKQLTDDGNDTVYNGYASWVYYEEILGRSSHYRAFWWSPSGDKLAFLRFDDSEVPRFTLCSAKGKHGELEVEHYPKAGDLPPTVRLKIALLDSGKTVEVKTAPDIDQYIAWPFWSPDSKTLYFQIMNRDQNNIQIAAANPYNGLYKVVYQEVQQTWVTFFEDLYFMKDNSGFILRSDKEGWKQLYFCDLRNGRVKKLTKERWNVTSLETVDEESGYIYFTGTGKNSTERHLYRVSLNGKKQEKLTSAAGMHICNVSPHGKYFIDRHSDINDPYKMELFNGDGKLIRTLADSKTEEAEQYALGKVEMFTIPSRDGFDLPAKWVLPPDFDKTKKYPVILYVYGGPDAPEVYNSYPGLFEFYLAQQGIIVMRVDHRGSGHFGKKGENFLYRSLGKWEMHDFIAVAKWLRKQPFIDASRIGITGGSYGGYVTLMAMTYGADYFTHGIADFSVTDWHLYDNVYTERYMDKPQDNPDGYNFASVLTYADKLKGKLLIIHGTMDDNVHMQNSIQLIDKLLDLDKDFEMMVYPGERHGFRSQKRFHYYRLHLKFWLRQFFNKEFEPQENQ